MEIVFNDLSWLLYGILIGLFVPLIFVFGNKIFGISSSLSQICSLIIPKNKKSFLTLKNDDTWKLYFAGGIFLGGIITSNFLTDEKIRFLPDEYYTLEGVALLFFGGILIGFGTRYADGCTSGHSITGLSLLKLSSLIATISFFVGGLIFTFIKYFVLA